VFAVEGGPDDVARIHPEDAVEWRGWLAQHHSTSPGVWLVTWRKAAGRPVLVYEAHVREALCFGWVDSLPRALDEERTMLYYAPRKPSSAWSGPNKRRVEELEAAGLMAPAGAAAVARARSDGTWTMLDAVERLEVPEDLAAAFDRHPGARAQWDAFPPSTRRGILEWIVQARRAETRASRVEATADKAARGERANQWRPRK
jgi:uncharacterized protein YdeI (YjbR/CyaY-like superfamily)